MFGDRQVSVISPATRDKEVFRWIPCRPGEVKDENSEIVDVISWVVSDVREMSENPTLVELLKETDRSSYDDVSKLCDVYNKAIIDLWDMWIEENTVPEFFNRKASRDHVQFILLQCYNRAVSDPEKLNQYPPFSPQVYGETSFELISQMIDTIAVTSDDVFIDLGSGVGQVVLQVCASTDAKFCYGIEKAEYPAHCASRLDSAFRHWMSFYGKSYRPYTLERGDFLSAEYQEKITNAGILFANNFAFGPEVDHQLKQRFANLKEGARIISSKAFCPLNFRITDRNLGDIGSIMRVSCLNPIQDAVSWTDKPFSYYVHTIDRSLLEQYFARLKNPKSKNENQTVRRDRKGRVISEATMQESSIQLTLNATDNNQHNTNGNVSHKAKRSPTIIKHCSSTSRCLPRRSASLLEVTASSPSELISVEGRKLSLQSCLSKNETISRQITSGSTAVHRMEKCESQHLQSELKRSHVHHKDNQSSVDIFTVSNDTSNTDLVESHVDTQLAYNHNEDGKQFCKVIRHLLDDPCETHSLPKSDNIKQSVRCKRKTITSDKKLTLNYPIIDDYPSLHSSSSHDQHDSRNSSSSPYVSSLSSANRSPNSQIDEITPSLNSLTKYSDLGLKSVQSPDLSIVPEDKLAKDQHEDSYHIRIKFKISNSSNSQNHPVSVKIKPPYNCDNMSNRLNSLENSNDRCDTNVMNEDHPNNVANRRIVRKCRQRLSDDSSSLNDTNFENSNNQTAVLRKRMQKHFMNSGNRNKSPSVHSNSCKTNNNNNKLKHTRRYSRDKVSHNMNVLHDYTVTHVQSQLTPTQFGLNDKRFPTYTCHYQPVDMYTESNTTQLSDSNLSDPHTGYNKSPIPFALTQYLELTKQAFMDHFAMLHSPAYASTIQSELEREHNRQAELLKHTKFLEQSIAKLHSDGTDLLNRFTKRLGILITTPAAFFSQARRLIKQHHVLEEKIAEFRRQISLLSSANQELVRRHHIEAARLLATATAIKSDNSLQNQHPTLNKLICSGIETKVTEINKNGFHYNSDNIIPTSTCSELNYQNAVSLNSVVIPPPPSLTKLSHNTLTCNKFGIPSIAGSDNLVSAHEMNQQHSLNPIKSSDVKLRTSNGAPSILHNNTDFHKFAPVLIKTVNTSNHSVVPFHTHNNKADCDHKVITRNSNSHNNNSNNIINNGTNHRIDKHMNIPPPPPLLPMHIHSDVYVDGVLSSANSLFDFNKHNYCNNNTNNNNISSLLPELNRSFITCRTDYDVSLIQSNYRYHTKSMHASLQDLILDEFSRETPCISVSNSCAIAKTNKNRNVYSISDSSYNYQYENNPNPVFQHHNHHNHHHKSLHPNYIDYSHQLNLPPRKRHWDSSNYNSTTTTNNNNNDSNNNYYYYSEECEPPKLSRECKSTDMETSL
ncbi:unnamed protein product [Schistosoma rodhaini]|uniref:Histone-lysine N-methyltransferase, H3 lysine-79 specific n=1 Tax=Schistosoma mansoni TaxID=6183 RepID=A0A3Q0KRT2_SCHMA|nr:unnamed protein product [Schistosoma rodhaini]